MFRALSGAKMMKTLKISGLALLLAALPTVVQAGDSPPAMPGPGGMPHMGMPRMGGVAMPRPGGPQMGGPRNWGGRQGGRWIGGHRAPGGWGAYRRPSIGFALPSYWVNPSFYLGNYGMYGLSRPTYGYGWSRYYDDAVLTDRYGRVQDSARVDWDRYDRYEDGAAGYGEDYSDSYGYRDNGYANDGRNSHGRGTGIVGAVVGGAIGALTGGIIAGKGDHLAGALIGGGVGAIAGAAIDGSSGGYGRGYRGNRIKHSKHHGRMDYDYGYGSGPDGVTQDGQWQGRWTGSWNGGPTQTWNGTYEGSQPHWNGPGAGYPEPQPYPHGRGGPVVVHQGGYYGGGYYGGGEVTTIVVQSQPITTTTTTTTEEVVYASAPRRRYAPRRVWHARPRPRAQCVCGS
jgi:hypothetical protein